MMGKQYKVDRTWKKKNELITFTIYKYNELWKEIIWQLAMDKFSFFWVHRSQCKFVCKAHPEALEATLDILKTIQLNAT